MADHVFSAIYICTVLTLSSENSNNDCWKCFVYGCWYSGTL